MKICKRIFLLLCATSLFSVASAKTEMLDSIVAVVNNQVISQTQLDQQTAMTRGQLRASHLPVPSSKRLRKQVLQHMIDTDLQLQMAKNLGIEVSNSDVDNAISNIAKQNHLSLSELKQKLNREGMGYSNYKKEMHKQLILRQVQRQTIGQQLSVTKAEINDALQSLNHGTKTAIEYHIQHILISVPDTPNPQQVQAAEKHVAQVEASLKKGGDFAKLAIANSDGAEAMQGGNWGWKKAQEIPDVFMKDIKKLKPGQYSKPIRTGNGFHIIRLAGIRHNTKEHYIPETHVEHILIRTNNGVTNKHAEQELVQLRHKLIKGQSFASLAKAYSQDPNSAEHGGDLGWVQPGMLTPGFEHAMNKLKIGQISQPVHSAFGWHLIKVIGRRQVPESESAQEARARELVLNRKFSKALENWLRKLRAQAYIKIINDHAS